MSVRHHALRYCIGAIAFQQPEAVDEGQEARRRSDFAVPDDSEIITRRVTIGNFSGQAQYSSA